MDKGLRLLRGRRQADEIVGNAPDERVAIGLGRGRESFAIEPGEDETINGIPAPLGFADGRKRRLFGLFKSPVQFILGALFDPLIDESDLLGRKTLAALRRRHLLILIRRVNAQVDFAIVELPGHDAFHSLLFGEGAFAGIQSAAGLARLRIEAVALEAILGEDRADLGIEIDARRTALGGERPAGEHTARQAQNNRQWENSERRHAGKTRYAVRYSNKPGEASLLSGGGARAAGEAPGLSEKGTLELRRKYGV